MKRISFYILTLFSLLGMALQSCTDELDLPNSGSQEIPKGITLRIPDPQGMTVTNTRAVTDGHLALAEKEGLLTNIYFVAFKDSETDPKDVIVEQLTDGEDYIDSYHSDTADGKKQFDLTKYFENKEAGNWYIYVLANVDAYLPEGVSISTDYIQSKADLDAMKLNFFTGSGESTTYLLDPELTAENGLPMVCLASDMMVMGKDDTAPQPASGGISLSSSTNAVIHADVSFLCAKVRYTILFDNENFSKDMFDGKSWKLNTVYASNNVYNLPYSLLGTKNDDAVKSIISKNLFDGERKYPTNASEYPTSEQAFIDNLGNPDTDAFPQRCFQGTFYLPGNSDTNALTSLAISAQEQHKDDKNQIQDGAELNYVMNLLPKGDAGIVNAHAYDIVAKVTGVEEFETNVVVEPWTVKTLVYSLKPATYLKIDKTIVDMTSGSNTEIEYTTNAETLSIDGPTVNVDGVDVQLYTLIKTENGKMYVSVNSQVPVSKYSEINSAIAADNYNKQYHEFYIVAGNIRKKIDIENLTLQRFLTVDPITITIDAREKISSGEYSGDLYVTIRTNLDKIYLNTGEEDASGNKVRQWYTITKGKSNCLSLVNSTNGNVAYWQSDNNQITLEGSAIPSDGVIKLKIHFDRVNTQDETFWNSSKVLTFVVSCDNEGLTPGPGYIFPEKVNVNILPNNDNYIIYFKDNDGWTNPHIYVYQCLELPMAAGSSPVGYYTYEDNNIAGANAALEYLFSGGVMFKGWDYGANRTSLNSMNGKTAYGFYIFDDSDDKSNWNPAEDASNERYYTNLDFNSEHRATGICYQCTGINNGWPGIGLHKVTEEEDPDNAGWWKYELSGLATPGKALLMFNDGHADNYTRRYPQSGENGIPLFDHPNRVGYINLSYTDSYYTNNGKDEHRRYNSTISQTSSGETTEEGINTIYFTNPKNWTNVYVYMYGDSGANSNWPGVKMTKVRDGLWSYTVPSDKTFTNVVFNEGSNTDNGGAQTGDIPFSKEYDTYDYTHAYTNTSYNGGGGNGGDDPAQTIYVVGDIKDKGWNSNQGVQMSYSNGVYTATVEFTGNRYFKFVTKLDSSWDVVNSSPWYGSTSSNESVSAGNEYTIKAYTGGDAHNFQYSTTGTVKIELNLTTKKVKFSR